jgi:hypothetical protein
LHTRELYDVYFSLNIINLMKLKVEVQHIAYCGCDRGRDENCMPSLALGLSSTCTNTVALR